MRRWLWVTLPDTYTNQPFRLGDEFIWSCHPDSDEKDVALLYRADWFKDFAYVFRQTTGPYQDAYIAQHFGGAPACKCTLSVVLQRPVTLPEVRSDPVLSQWPAALVGFHGTAFPIEPAEWDALVALTSPVDRPRVRAVGGR